MSAMIEDALFWMKATGFNVDKPGLRVRNCLYILALVVVYILQMCYLAFEVHDIDNLLAVLTLVPETSMVRISYFLAHLSRILILYVAATSQLCTIAQYARPILT